MRRRGLPGSQLVLELCHLQLQARDAPGLRIAIRILRLVGGWIVEQRVPLFPRRVDIQGRLAIERQTEQYQSGYPCHGR